ncbi:MAG: hypothetical protein HC905_22720 [Bacteroidales bacterium]|nr:hypothetical protein [Bacteroidales bacterium]
MWSYSLSPICLYLNSEVLYLNPKWTETLGYTLEDMPTLDKMLLKCLPAKKERSKFLFIKIKSGDNNFDLPDIFLNITIKNNEVRYMKLNFIAMKDKRTMITLEDYTIRKKVEEDLNLARIKAEEADSLKSAFLANMSHEIRTPMNAILGFSELLQKENLSYEKRHKYLSHINNSSQSLLNLINDILDISKIEAGQLNIQKEKSNLSLLFQSVDAEIKIIRSTMKKNHIDIQFRNNLSEEMDKIVTDSLRLKQILMNLLSNALKFTNEGLIEFGCSEDKDLGIRFYVKDSGIGIKENHLDDIFNRFTKIEEDLSKVFRGAGLGLAISKKLTEALGGKMWVESVYGQGSTFYFTLPVNNLH